MSEGARLAGLGRVFAGSLRYRVWLLLSVVLGISCTQLPLLQQIGFESAFASALLGSLAAIDIASRLVLMLREQKPKGLDRAREGSSPFGLWLLAGTLSLGPALLPSLVLLAWTVVVPSCDLWFGVKAALAMAGLSALFAAGLGLAIATVFGHDRLWRRFAPFSAALVLALLSLLRFYSSPAVFSYNALVGYFPGNFYDPAIELAPPFWFARLFDFAWLTALLSILALFWDAPTCRVSSRPRPLGLRKRAIGAGVVSLALALVLWVQSGHLGFAVSAGDIQGELSASYRSDHFVIHYSPNRALSESMPLIAADHEFRLAQLVRDLDIPAPKAKIHSYYFHSPEEKHRLMGARHVYMAKPWRNEIYIHHLNFPHQVLRHELAHVLASRIGDPIFGVSAKTLAGVPVFFNVGMIEGLAVASDWPDHFGKELTPHQSAKALAALNLLPSMQGLFSTAFLAGSSARSYTLAGSFVRFIWDRHGLQAVKQLYQNGGDFEQATQRSFAELDRDWRAYIQTQKLSEEDLAAIEERFRRPGIFGRACPHAVSKVRREAAKNFAAGRDERALDLANRVCRLAPGDPQFRLELGQYLMQAGKLREAQELYELLIDEASGLSADLRGQALLGLIHLQVAETHLDEAETLAEELGALSTSADLRRHAAVVVEVLSHRGPAREDLLRFFWGQKPGAQQPRPLMIAHLAHAIMLEPELGLLHYLLGRQLAFFQAHEEATRSLKRALRSPALHPLVTVEAQRLLATAAFAAKDYDSVRRAATFLRSADQSESTRLQGYDWLERLTFANEGRLPERPLGYRDGVVCPCDD